MNGVMFPGNSPSYTERWDWLHFSNFEKHVQYTFLNKVGHFMEDIGYTKQLIW